MYTYRMFMTIHCLHIQQENVHPEESKSSYDKLLIKRPNLESKFLLAQEEREKTELKLKQLLIEKQEAQRKADLEEQNKDSLHGKRVHAWVLILATKRDVEQPVFIGTSLVLITMCLTLLDLQSQALVKRFW
jgi:hypothetical protein